MVLGMIKEHGLLIVISGPSGSGKTSITKILRETEANLNFSISATTRPPRPDELDGVDYYFFSEVEFQHKIEAGEFAEWAVYGSHHYGTLKKTLNDTLQSGKDILLEIEVQGAIQLRKLYPDGIFIFIIPPSQASLEARLRNRRTESEDDIRRRLLIAKSEISYINNYDYIVFNYDNQIEKAVENVRCIIAAVRCRVNRYILRQIQKEFNL
ncbi:TPA: guanylate kinase [Candidatus Poribacteria bacterium]|nr:guanylate kinase [Candidatus Poribacteria bacterium]